MSIRSIFRAMMRRNRPKQHHRSEFAGRIWKMPGPKRQYRVAPGGNLIRIHPNRPWRGKSQRRAIIKLRREEKEALSYVF